MTEKIGLHELIEQVTEELLIPRKVTKPEELYPLLFVEEIEIQVAVNITKSGTGSGKLSIQVVELNLGGEASLEKTNTLKIKLTPLISKEELVNELKKEERTWAKFNASALRAMLKSSDSEHGPRE